MGSREPLATDRLVASEEKIEGTEDKQTLQDWFENVAMKVNLVYPGSKAILDRAAGNVTEIAQSEMNRRGDNVLGEHAIAADVRLFEVQDKGNRSESPQDSQL